MEIKKTTLPSSLQVICSKLTLEGKLCYILVTLNFFRKEGES